MRSAKSSFCIFLMVYHALSGANFKHHKRLQKWIKSHEEDFKNFGLGHFGAPAMAYRFQRLYSIRCDIPAPARNHNFSSRTSLSGTNLHSAILRWLDHQHVTAHWLPALHMLDAGHQNYKITISKPFAPQVLEACWLVCRPFISPEGATSGWA